jgi:hypothetical protein
MAIQLETGNPGLVSAGAKRSLRLNGGVTVRKLDGLAEIRKTGKILMRRSCMQFKHNLGK